ncbi:MAG: 2-amino-4-hydroxy-6-hydroxymethyldihydropteridine diphosphokinase, partial [Treponema sp.]|nr:2-amino-4-hydroxy-6-hydroxymethyldihydropteridine diphosphokinase [Treponema sp.]
MFSNGDVLNGGGPRSGGSVHCVLSLGSNKPWGGLDREGLIAAAAEALRETLGAFRLSPVYETAPLGVTDQGSFLNAAACGLFPLEAAGGGRADTPPDRLVSAAGELLRLVQGIEARYGRDRAAERRWGERSLDIDILLLGNAVIREPDLTVPHPRLAERAFALR